MRCGCSIDWRESGHAQEQEQRQPHVDVVSLHEQSRGFTFNQSSVKPLNKRNRGRHSYLSLINRHIAWSGRLATVTVVLAVPQHP